MSSKIFCDNALYAEAFLQHMLEHPDDAERIPDNAVILFSGEELDPQSSSRNRLTVKLPEAYRERTAVLVSVRETGDTQRRYEFVFPWTEPNVRVRLDHTEWNWEPLTAALAGQTENLTKYFDRPIYALQRFRLEPVTSKST